MILAAVLKDGTRAKVCEKTQEKYLIKGRLITPFSSLLLQEVKPFFEQLAIVDKCLEEANKEEEEENEQQSEWDL